MFATQQSSQQQKRSIDISLLQDYKLNTRDDFTHWQEFNHQQYDNIPLGFNNKFNFNRNIKYCDLAQCQDDIDFVIVQDNIKRKAKDFISKNNRMTQNRQAANTKRAYTKKMQKNQRNWTNQIKTNFKKITVKNNWKQIKTINKNALQGLPQAKNLKVNNLKTIGNLNFINPAVDRVKWQQVRFKQNTTYTVQPIKTIDDKYLTQIASKLMQDEENKRTSFICNPTFLFALLTLKAGVYPWSIEIQKAGNLIVLQSFKSADDQKQRLSYLDLYTANQNTTNNMPIQQTKIKQVCIAATKMEKVFQDLLASGDRVPREDIEEHFVDNQQQDEQQKQQQQGQEQQDQDEQQNKQQLEKLRKYIKISFQNIDIYSYVQIDGIKKNNTTGELQYLLIRTFMQSETQGAWIKDMKTPGAMITKQYHSNSCSIQKWICQAKLAGVEDIKTGYIGITQNKTPILLNVDTISVKSMETTLSFKYESCWNTVKYILGLLAPLDDGTYVLAKNPYSPLTMKLYKTADAEEESEEQEQPEGQRKNTQDKEQEK